MAAGDVAFVVAEQLRLFPHGMVGRLGPRFVSAYVRTFPDSPGACALVAEHGGHQVGYLLGLADGVEHRRHALRRHGVRLLVAGISGATRHPAHGLRILRRLLAPLVRRTRATRSSPGPEPLPVESGPVAVLSFIAVLEQARSLGAGRALITDFLAHAEQAGCARAALVTVAGPDGASAFYERTGWVARGEIQTPEGRTLIAYDRELGTPGPPPSRDAGAPGAGGAT
ncbi:MAG: GNAT family N-acetyltransferase [Sporichthyaceae bacterium]